MAGQMKLMGGGRNMRWRAGDMVWRRVIGLVLTVAGSVMLALIVPTWLWSGLLAVAIIWLGIMVWRA